MKILVTGSKGFIGQNLISQLKNNGFNDLYEYDIDSDPTDLKEATGQCDFVFHLAGVNRPKNTEDFMSGNFGLTVKLIDYLSTNEKKPTILCTSSIQAMLDNPYGESKKAAEDEIFLYGKDNNINVLIYRLPNVFGKWCRPNYNSVVATFCYNIANDLPIQINNPKTELELVYIDDVVEELIQAINGHEHRNGDFCFVPTTHKVTLGEIVSMLKSFKESRSTLLIPNLADGFEKKLYSTYLSYLPEDGFSYKLKMNIDARGSFTEILKTNERGQVSVNVIKPGITKGNHWHHSKNEKFLTVYGEGVVRFRKIGTDKIIEYPVDGNDLTVIDIPCGYTHNISNTSDKEMVTVMWANEPFDPQSPDTFYLEV